jgi:ferredoxin
MSGQVSVNPELCIGSGECVRLLPASFRIDESLGASVPLAGAARAERAALLRARDSCPTHAIEIADENGDQLPAVAGER